MHVEWGAVLAVVLLPILMAVYFVTLSMDWNRYEWSTRIVAEALDGLIAAIRGVQFDRRGVHDDWRAWLRPGAAVPPKSVRRRPAPRRKSRRREHENSDPPE